MELTAICKRLVGLKPVTHPVFALLGIIPNSP